MEYILTYIFTCEIVPPIGWSIGIGQGQGRETIQSGLYGLRFGTHKTCTRHIQSGLVMFIIPPSPVSFLIDLQNKKDITVAFSSDFDESWTMRTNASGGGFITLCRQRRETVLICVSFLTLYNMCFILWSCKCYFMNGCFILK